jgi:hypothetical protein
MPVGADDVVQLFFDVEHMAAKFVVRNVFWGNFPTTLVTHADIPPLLCD